MSFFNLTKNKHKCNSYEIIRKDFEQEFCEKVLAKYEGYINVEVVFQAIDKLLYYSNESIGNKK